MAGSCSGVGAGWQIKGVSDLNNDGYDDIIWFHPASGSVYVWLMTSGGVGSILPVGQVTPGWTIQKIGDFDGDGRADILWRNNITNVIWYMNGASIALVDLLPAVDINWSVIAVGDYTADGRYEILWRHTSGAVYQWTFQGRGVAPTVSAVGAIDGTWSVVGQP